MERPQHKTAVRVKRTNGQRGRHPFSKTQVHKLRKPLSLKSNVQSYFIHKSTAITVSSHRQSECVISSIFLKADSLTIIELPLLFWHPESRHWGGVWVFLPVKPLSTHTSSIISLAFLCLDACFLFLLSSCFCSQKAHLSLQMTIFTHFY